MTMKYVLYIVLQNGVKRAHSMRVQSIVIFRKLSIARPEE